MTPDLSPPTGRRSRMSARLVQIAQVVIPGAYAWAVTVVPVATSRNAPWLADVTALMAFVCLIMGAFQLEGRYQRWAPVMGIWGFVLLSLATWGLHLPALQIDRLDPYRAAAGSIGWMLFAFGWGSPWRARHPEDNPRAQLHPKLEPRNPALIRRPLVLAIATAGAVGCLMLAWRSAQPGRGLMLHGVALACAVATVTAAASVALAQDHKRNMLSPQQRLAFALPWAMAFAAVLVVAAAWYSLR